MTTHEKVQSVLDALNDEVTVYRNRLWPFPARRITLRKEQVEGILCVATSNHGGFASSYELSGLSRKWHCGKPMVTVDHFFSPVHPAFVRRPDSRSAVCSVCGFAIANG